MSCGCHSKKPGPDFEDVFIVVILVVILFGLWKANNPPKMTPRPGWKAVIVR